MSDQPRPRRRAPYPWRNRVLVAADLREALLDARHLADQEGGCLAAFGLLDVALPFLVADLEGGSVEGWEKIVADLRREGGTT